MADSDDEDDGRISEQQMAKARKAIDLLSSLDLPCSSKEVLGSSTISSTRPHRRFTPTVPSSQAASRPSALSLSGISSRVSSMAASPTFTHSRMSRESTNLIQEADKALETLRWAKSFPGNKRKARKEADMLFNKKRSTSTVWRHTFVCLPYIDQPKIPTTDFEKDTLLKSGLGEQTVQFSSIDIDGDEFKDVILETFPKLLDGGGYMFYKCMPNSRVLEPLSESVLSSPKVLKERVGTTKRTYIKPLQRDLDLSEVYSLPKGPVQKCLTCDIEVSMGELAEHIKTCGKKEEYSDSEESNDDIILPKVVFPSRRGKGVKPPLLDLTDDIELEKDEGAHSRFSVDSSYDPFELSAIEEHMIQRAMEQSIEPVAEPTDSESVADTPLQKALKLLQSRLSHDDDRTLNIGIRRDNVLQDVMSAKLDPLLKFTVHFIGEGGIDQGGPKRELFRLFCNQAADRYLMGPSDYKFFICDVASLLNREFYKFGVFTVLSIINNGSGAPFFAPAVYDYFLTGNMHVEGVPGYLEPSLKLFVDGLLSAESNDDIQSCLTDDSQNLLFATGYRKPLTQLTLDDVPSIVDILLDFHLLVKVKASMDQYMEGLETANFLNDLRKDPVLWKPYFIYENIPLTAEYIKSLFSVSFSKRGSNVRAVEEQAFLYFSDLLNECEAKEVDLKLEDVLIFCSGTDHAPPTGFSSSASLKFLYHSWEVLPTVSTCDIELRIPTSHKQYDVFRDYMVSGIKGDDGFSEV